jgi:hypothetical protein
MAEGTQEQPPQAGDANPGVDDDVTGRGDEGRRAADVTPPIADDAEQGQTQVPSAPDDAGVPSDEELAREEEG